MGAWGIGAFENDSALDLVGDMRDGVFSFDEIRSYENDDYLEVDGGEIALALAAIATAVVHNEPSPVEDLNLASVQAHFTPQNIAFVKALGERTLSDAEHSEAYELWEETGELDAWLTASRAILSRLP